MNSFSRMDIITLQKEIKAALDAVAQKHNLAISMGNVRFSPFSTRFSKIEFVPKNPTTALSQPSISSMDPYNTVESRSYISNAYKYNLPMNGLGKKFSANGKMYTIIGLKPSFRKYPVIAADNSGRRFKFSAERVRNSIT